MFDKFFFIISGLLEEKFPLAKFSEDILKAPDFKDAIDLVRVDPKPESPSIPKDITDCMNNHKAIYSLE